MMDIDDLRAAVNAVVPTTAGASRDEKGDGGDAYPDLASVTTSITVGDACEFPPICALPERLDPMTSANQR